MKILTVFLAAALAPVWAQPLQFPASFEQLAAKATESTNVNLDAAMLQAAGKVADSQQKNSGPLVSSLVSNLKAVQVRTFEFAKEGEYSDSDVAPIRAQLKTPEWSQIVSTSNKKEREGAEIYFHRAGEKIIGIVVIAMEPKELTVVHVDGEIDPSKITAMGVPDVASKIAYDLSRQVPPAGTR